MNEKKSKYIRTSQGNRLICRICGKQWNVSKYAQVQQKGYICPKCAAREQRERFTKRVCALMAVCSFIGTLGTIGGIECGTISPIKGFLMASVLLFLLIITAGRAGAFITCEWEDVSDQPEQERKAS